MKYCIRTVNPYPGTRTYTVPVYGLFSPFLCITNPDGLTIPVGVGEK